MIDLILCYQSQASNLEGRVEKDWLAKSLLRALLYLFCHTCFAANLNWHQIPLSEISQEKFYQLNDQSHSVNYREHLGLPDTSELRFKYISMRLERRRPVFIVQNSRGKLLEMHLGPQVHADYVSQTLLKEIGLSHTEVEYRRFSIIKMENEEIKDIVSFWSEQTKNLDWDDHLFFHEERNALVLSRVLLKPLKRPVAADNPLKISSSMTLALAWLQGQDFDYHDLGHNQDNQIVPYSLDLTLGHALSHSSVGSLGTHAFIKQKKRSRKKTKSLIMTTAPYRGKLMIRGLNEVNAEKVKQFLELTKKLDESRIEEIFLEATYPEGIAKLYAKKLNDRLHNMKALAFNDPSFMSETSKNFSYGTLIQNGELIRNDLSFPVEMTESVVENLIAKTFESTKEKISNLASVMLSAAPFMGYDFNLSQNLGIGPSAAVRIKRSVRENPEAQGIDDLYLTVDRLMIGVVVGFGYSGNLAGQTSWARLGPGYFREITYARTARTRVEAEKLPWKNIFTRFLTPKYNQIKPGETVAVKNSWMFGTIAGGNLKYSGFKSVRIGGYLLAGAMYDYGSQVHHHADGSWSLLKSDFYGARLATKFYLRLWDRIFRIPIFGANIGAATGGFKAYVSSQDNQRNFDPLEKKLWQHKLGAALVNAEVPRALKYFEVHETEADYWSKKLFYNLYFFNGKYLSSSASEDYHSPVGEERHFDIIHEKRSRSTHHGEEQSCQGHGVLEYRDQKKNFITSGGISLSCRHHKQNLSTKEQRKFLENIAAQFVFNHQDLKKDFPIFMGHHLPKISAKVKIVLSWEEIKNSLQKAVPQNASHWLKRFVNRVKNRSPLDQLKQVLRELKSDQFENKNRRELLTFLNSGSAKLTIVGGGTENYVYEEGKAVENEALDYLELRENLTGQNFLRDY